MLTTRENVTCVRTYIIPTLSSIAAGFDVFAVQECCEGHSPSSGVLDYEIFFDMIEGDKTICYIGSRCFKRAVKYGCGGD